MRLPGIFRQGDQDPADDGQVPILTADLDPQVIVVLVETIYTAHARILLSDYIRLQHSTDFLALLEY